MSNKKVSFVLMLDVSGSMSSAIDDVKRNAKAFVRQGRIGDQFGVNAFSTNVTWVYPTGTNPDIVTISSTDLTETETAANKIQLLKALNMTNLGQAIKMSNKMIEHSTNDLKAFVILSDGVHNTGPNPASELNANPPIFVAGLGAYLNKSYFEPLLEKNSKSKFYQRPEVFDMMMMFEYIRGDMTDSILSINKRDSYSGSDYNLNTFNVTTPDSETQTKIVWTDSNYQYTPGDVKPNRVRVSLIDPSNKKTSIKPDICGDGYCIYNHKNLQPGTWKIISEYTAPKQIYATTSGIDYTSNLSAKLSFPAVVDSSDTLKYDLTVMSGKTQLENLDVSASYTCPLASVDDVLDRYSNELKNIELTDSEVDSAGNIDSNIIKLNKLRGSIQSKTGTDILGVRRQMSVADFTSDGKYTDSLTETNVKGIYTVDIKIEGINPETGFPFTILKTGSNWGIVAYLTRAKVSSGTAILQEYNYQI